MTTTTCLVCGAAEEPAADHTCPVCGADLPTATEEAPQDADDPAPDAAGDTASTDSHAAVDGEPSIPAEGTAPPPHPTAPGPSSRPPTATAPVPPPPPSGGTPPPTRFPNTGYDPSHPSGIPAALRTYGMLTHLSAFAGAIVALAFVGPLVMWLIRRDEHPFLDHHGKEALNFNLSLLLYGVIGIVAAFVTVGIGLVVVIPAAIVFFFTWVITTIVAAVKANNGEGYRYPLTIRFIGDDV